MPVCLIRIAIALLLLLLVVVEVRAAERSPDVKPQRQNFLVEAPSPEVARRVLEVAEQQRKAQALTWLGEELPPWPEPCRLKVTVGKGSSGGATTFAFDSGRVLSRSMHADGSLDRILENVLPHEITHTILADHFRRAVPRWADEGAAVLSEDENERVRHDQVAREILQTPGRAMTLRKLFTLKDYPADVLVLYAQGFSVTDFLVARKDRNTFLNFVYRGSGGEWDAAAQKHYGFRTIEELEEAWLDSLREKDSKRAAEKGDPPR